MPSDLDDDEEEYVDEEELAEETAEAGGAGIADEGTGSVVGSDAEWEDEDGLSGSEKAGSDDEEGDPKIVECATYTKFCVKRGAHAVYQVPERFFQHRAEEPLAATGRQIGQKTSSRAQKYWNDLCYSNIHIIGGTNQSGDLISAPFVCFKPPNNVVSDDEIWARQIPTPTFEMSKAKWLKKLAGDEKTKPNKVAKLRAKFAPVLTWSKQNLRGSTTLNPESLGVGEGGFRLLPRNLKTCKVNPVDPHKQASSANKLVSAIHKTKLQRCSTSTDACSEASEFTQVETAKTVLLGPASSVQTFEKDGQVFATIM